MKLSNLTQVLDKKCKKEDGWEKEETDESLIYQKQLISNAYEQSYIRVEIMIDNWVCYEDEEEKSNNFIEDFEVCEIFVYHPFLITNENEPFYLSNEEEFAIVLPKLLNLFDKDISEIKLEILKSYIKITEKFKVLYESVILDLGFIPYLDSSLTEGIWYNHAPMFKNMFQYIHKDTSVIIAFVYNYLTDSFYCFLNESFDSVTDIFLLTKEEFYIEISMILSKDPTVEYLLSADPKHTKYTWYIVTCLMDGISSLRDHNRLPGPARNESGEIAFNYDETDSKWYEHIPEKYKNYIETYESLKQNYYDNIAKNNS